MSDIIRQAQAMYGPAFEQMMQEAGRIKEEYVQAGGDPDHVYSPERMELLQARGPQALAEEDAMVREDGSVAGPYVPAELALANNMIEPRAVPSVLSALRDGVNTVSSGVDRNTGMGFAIGRGPDGSVVRVEEC